MDGGEAAKGTEPVSAAGAGDVNISVELSWKRSVHGQKTATMTTDGYAPSPIEG